MTNYELDLMNNSLDFVTAVNKLPETAQTELPENYGYLWAKCSLMMNVGFERYAKGDYFHFPLNEWITEDFKSVVDQIVNDLKGFNSESPITIKDTITMHYFLNSMHFKINLIQDFDDYMQVDAKHLVDDEDNGITIFFTQKKL
jgi:hypothetical protein